VVVKGIEGVSSGGRSHQGTLRLASFLSVVHSTCLLAGFVGNVGVEGFLSLEGRRSLDLVLKEDSGRERRGKGVETGT